MPPTPDTSASFTTRRSTSPKRLCCPTTGPVSLLQHPLPPPTPNRKEYPMKNSLSISLTMIGILMSTPALAQSHSTNASGGTGVSENVDSSTAKTEGNNQANDSNPSN